MIRINLLAEERRAPAVRRAKAGAPRDFGQILLLVALLVGVVAAAGHWWLLKSKLDAKDREIRSAQRRVDELAPIIAEVEAYQDQQAQLEHKIAVISELSANQRGPVSVMDSISRALPELLWLTSLEMSASTIKLRGSAFNNNAVAAFTEALDEVEGFQEPDFKETKRTGQVYDFAVDLGFQLLPLRETPAEGGPAAGGGDAEPAAAGAGG